MTKVRPDHSTSRTLAALIGTVPVSLSWGIALALALPLSLESRFALGWYAVIPLWLMGATWAFLARSSRQAWNVLSVAFVVGAAVSLAALACGRGVWPPFGLGS